MPVNGPFMLDPDNPPVVDEYITLIKNPSYYGYGLGWGPYNVDKLILQWVKDPPTRLAGLVANDIDFGEYPTAPVTTFQDLMTGYPNLRVVQYDYPASNPIWLNFNNEYLSNRYVRLAIAYAIDYDYIINNILQPWGIETAYRGLTYIMPNQYYEYGGTEVQLFNTAINPYEQNVTKALEYMERWKKSQQGSTGTVYPNGEYLDGAAGDADWSGKVGVLDLGIWRDEGWPVGTMSAFDWLPGQDKDPDFNNDGSIDQNPDYFIYRDEVPGKTYFKQMYP
jgi:ABC-type oligopeptide transport system substrate-binding subunit